MGRFVPLTVATRLPSLSVGRVTHWVVVDLLGSTSYGAPYGRSRLGGGWTSPRRMAGGPLVVRRHSVRTVPGGTSALATPATPAALGRRAGRLIVRTDRPPARGGGGRLQPGGPRSSCSTER